MKRASSFRLMAVVFASLFVAIRASADTVSLDANLDPFQEVPPHNTPGYGSADFTIDTTTLSLSVVANTGIYADLLAGATTVRIQDAAVGMNGPTQFLLTLDTPGNTSGTFSGSGTLTNAAYNDALAGNLYVNISDSVFPSGEIRGQLLVVPEPASMTLLAGAGLLALRRRARRVA
jgi:hypothetical protein